MSARLRNRSRDAVFLAYHSVADEGPPFLSLTPETFERQLALLRRLGFRSGGRAELAQLAAGERPSSRLAFLTFDDGYLDNFELAAPLLDAYGFRATIFVIPPLVDSGGAMRWPRVSAHADRYPDVMRSMTWPMVEELRERGHEFGSHTLTHPHLPELDDERLREELVDSRTRVAARLGTCDTIAYPFGEWSRRVADAAADAGYRGGFTLPYADQRSADVLTVPRVNVDHRDDERRFHLKLTAPYRSLLLSRLKPAARTLLRRRPAGAAQDAPV